MKKIIAFLLTLTVSLSFTLTVFADYSLDEADGSADAKAVFEEVMQDEALLQQIIQESNSMINNNLREQLTAENKSSYEDVEFFTKENITYYDGAVYYPRINSTILLKTEKGLEKSFEKKKDKVTYMFYLTDNNGNYTKCQAEKQDGKYKIITHGTVDENRIEKEQLKDALDNETQKPDRIYYAQFLIGLSFQTVAFCFFEDSSPVIYVMDRYNVNAEKLDLKGFKHHYIANTNFIQAVFFETVVCALLITALVLIIILINKRIKFKPKELSEEEIKAYKKKRNKKLVSVIILLLVLILFYIGYSLFGHRAAKPIIYIYPQQETVVNVKLDNYGLITCSYPEYNEKGWTVKAEPDGNLYDLDTNRNLYSLYYEAEMKNPARVTNEGFVVKGEDSTEFLEEKLAVLGLSDREAEEFIIYWLPRLEANKYNYIRFLSEEEISYNMPLNISPKPDTTIRVFMAFKGLDIPIKVEEQELQSAERSGYTVVEWGGTEIK